MTSSSAAKSFPNFEMKTLQNYFLVLRPDGTIRTLKYAGSISFESAYFSGEQNGKVPTTFATGERIIFSDPLKDDTRLLVDEANKIVELGITHVGNTVHYRHRELRGPEPIGLCYRDEPEPTCIAASPDGTLLAIGDAGGGVSLVETATMNRFLTRFLAMREDERTEPVTKICFSPDGTRMLLVLGDSRVTVYRIETKTEKKVSFLSGIDVQAGSASVIYPLRDNANFLLGDALGVLWNYDAILGSWQVVQKPRYQGAISALAMSQSGNVRFVAHGHQLTINEPDGIAQQTISGFARPITRIVPFLDDRYVFLDVCNQDAYTIVTDTGEIKRQPAYSGPCVLDFGSPDFGRMPKKRKPNPFTEPFG